ncbi:transcription initiation factor TFIIIB [Alkaliphilus peptidifermentans]|uniref:Transcription initiation factor TFIIIB n=1 Tax=Alkaliphilus peptidifermentans DSM 18978 TaxID=1120976 RepID=A0A1G5GUQ5_9FIRM|nr:transcription initiation factor TFIIIB [Alkaliphilus peptidifermentans]SCY54900.1 hypothetical protein SAMN03080606_01774 [Alkaliphilus peptidifermentans DSM 18978]
MENNKECPICRCKDIGQGKQMGHACMIPIGKIFKGSGVIADICTECGHILSTRVDKPEIFKIKK